MEGSAADLIDTHHKDYVQHVAYNYFGQRLACCSSDRTVKIFDKEEGSGWRLHLGCDFIAHRGAIWRVCWAHPEFGQLLATCGEDHVVHIWEEQSSYVVAEGADTMRWHQKATLSDSRRPVRDIEFAPNHLGLRLAAASQDGTVRIYDAVDVMNLEHWPVQGSFDTDVGEMGCLSLSWSKSAFDPPAICVGGHDGSVQLWREDEHGRWAKAADVHTDGSAGAVVDVDWAPNIGRSFNLLAIAKAGGGLHVCRLGRGDEMEVLECTALSLGGSRLPWRVQWNAAGTLLACSTDDGFVSFFKSGGDGWVCVSQVVSKTAQL